MQVQNTLRSGRQAFFRLAALRAQRDKAGTSGDGAGAAAGGTVAGDGATARARLTRRLRTAFSAMGCSALRL